MEGANALDIFKKAWNWKPDSAFMKTVKMRALRMLSGFFVLMLSCTMISRAADSMTVPIATTTEPKRAAITNGYAVDGVLALSGGVPVVAPAGMLITGMNVAENDAVNVGDLLFTYDITDTQREIAAKQLTIQGLNTEIASLRKDQEKLASKDKTALERADEDYAATQEKQDLKVQESGERMRQARTELKDYDDSDDYTDAEYNRLRSSYRAAIIAYDQAILERDEALRNAQRSIADIGDTDSGSALELKTLEIRKSKLELSALNEIVALNGEIYAPASGIITNLNMSAGKRTTAESVALIADKGGLRFTAEITKEQRKYVNAGDSIALTLSGEDRPNKGVTVLSVMPVADKPSMFLMTAELGGDIGEPGVSASAEISNKTQTYEQVIPLSALYGSRDAYYILTVKETEGTLGMEYVAEKMSVTVLEQGADTVAISGAVTSHTRIICDSSKPIREGDRIRLNP